jgi:hypothetical protein
VESSYSHPGDSPLLLPPRRIHPRYPVQKIASYQYRGKDHLTLTVDLGLGGMKIRTHERLSEEEHLDLRLVLGRDSIRMRGRIVYSQFLPEKAGVSGVQFVEISDQSQTALADYLGTLDQWSREGRVAS